MNIVSAGKTPLLNVFKNGAILIFISEASGKSLRVMKDGDVEGNGGEGGLAQFKVHVRGEGRVALQNVANPEFWLRIHNDDLNGHGKEGGGHTEFKLEEHHDRIVFESAKFSSQHVGILDSGDSKKPSNTGTGKHAQFQPKVIREVPEIIAAGTSRYEKLLAHGNVVILESVASGKSLRVHDDGRLDGDGGRGALAQFISHVVSDNVIKLQSMKNRERWLMVKKNTLTVGKGGRSSEFKVDHNNGHLVLEAVKFPGCHVGVKDDGSIKNPDSTGKGKHGQFKVEVMKEQPEYHRAGTSLLERTLHHGNEVVLYSRSSEKTLRIKDDKTVEGRGGEGALARFIVHVRAPHVVALQNKKQSELYLRAEPHKLTHAAGNSKCNFIVKDNGHYLLFESEDHRGMHIGILPDGDVKPPKDTHEGERAQFTPKVMEDSPYSRPH